MHAEMGRKVRFSDAAYAINTSPKALRNWLARKLVKLRTPVGPGGWADFTFYDIAVLALVRKLVDVGIALKLSDDVLPASDIANAVVDRFSSAEHMPTMPPDALVMLWKNRRLRIHHDWNGTVWPEIVDIWLPESAMEEKSDCYIVINVSGVLGRAFDRAWESVNDGATGDEGDDDAS